MPITWLLHKLYKGRPEEYSRWFPSKPPYHTGSYKCNKFVFDKLAERGFDVPRFQYKPDKILPEHYTHILQVKTHKRPDGQQLRNLEHLTKIIIILDLLTLRIFKKMIS